MTLNSVVVNIMYLYHNVKDKANQFLMPVYVNWQWVQRGDGKYRYLVYTKYIFNG